MKLLFAILACLAAASAVPAEIVTVRAFGCRECPAKRGGELDWNVFEPEPGGGAWKTTESSQEGKGIEGVSPSPDGGVGARVLFGEPPSGQAMASLVVGGEGVYTVTARQGRSSRATQVSRAASVFQVIFDGGPLAIDVSAGADQPPARITATLSMPAYWWIRDGRLALLYRPLSSDDLQRSIYRSAAPDYLEVARRFADHMLRYGRDRYGKVQSPLFASILTREEIPAMTPYPLFRKRTAAQKEKAAKSRAALEAAGHFVGPFERFDFNRLLNYPDGLGDAGPHKITLFGADPMEDRDLYSTLFELSRITGDRKYSRAASAALRWWFLNTQGPAGLYPWGEHMGWDLVNDCPTYFDGPSRFLYRANEHEVKDFVPFLDYLAALPAPEPGAKTPLDSYALGIWNMHFWDKERAYYNRHGDYTGKEDQTELGAYPAHLAFYLRVWTAAYLRTGLPDVKEQLAEILNRSTAMAVSRTEKWGFFPQTLRPEMEGEDPGKIVPLQSLRLAHHAAWLAERLARANPAVAARLGKLSQLHLGTEPRELLFRHLEWAEAIGDTAFLQHRRSTRLPGARRALTPSVLSEDYATEILYFVRLYKETRQEAYLRSARVYARLAYERFCDEKSPLPRAFAVGAPIQTPAGDPFPDFYFRGARLMRSFALLGEVMNERKRD